MPSSAATLDPPVAPVLIVRTADGRSLRFDKDFHIGREGNCEVCIQDSRVSRRHVLVSHADGEWTFRDLQSANGVFVDGQRVYAGSVQSTVSLVLGIDGPTVALELEGRAARRTGPVPAETVQAPVRETVLIQDYAERYFGKGQQGPAGGRTMMIRKAFERVQKKQKRQYWAMLGVLGAVAIAAAIYAYRSHQKMQQQVATAEELFYMMKALDVEVADIERRLAESGAVDAQDQIRRYLARRRQLETEYDRYLSTLNVYGGRLSDVDRLILRMSRVFGECELAAPPDFLSEVKHYIERWKSTSRFENGIRKAQEMGYAKRIAEEFIGQNLPPQFLYLALQESDFNEYASGPPTYMGIAKGMWQFVPDTARRFGLTIGPLANARTPDPADDRHHWEKATHAAARYIKEIYSTDAQASGLLVMAGYNWGEGRVIRLLKSMPQNPRERNLWEVLKKHRDRFPKETYDYVFSILSAAVIGENPRLFGFTFDNPLAFLEEEKR